MDTTALQHGDARVLWRWAGTAVIWGAIVLALSLTGAFGGISLLFLPALIAVGVAVPLWLVSRSPQVLRIVRDVDLAHMTLFNTSRVLAGTALLAFGATGLLPWQFAAITGSADLTAGLIAPVVVVLAARLTARRRRMTYLVYHVVGLVDLVVVVASGVTFILLGDPMMRALLDTPMAFIVLWGLPLNGVFSLLALHRLVTRHR